MLHVTDLEKRPIYRGALRMSGFSGPDVPGTRALPRLRRRLSPPSASRAMQCMRSGSDLSSALFFTTRLDVAWTFP